MKSHYGNLLVDILDLVFAFVSLLLVWLSYAKDSIVFFGISTVIYILPRLLTIIMGIINNGRDVVRLVMDFISLIALLAAFVIVCLFMFDYAVDGLSGSFNSKVAGTVFYVCSALSLFDIFQKVITGIVQKFSITLVNSKSKSV